MSKNCASEYDTCMCIISSSEIILRLRLRIASLKGYIRTYRTRRLVSLTTWTQSFTTCPLGESPQWASRKCTKVEEMGFDPYWRILVSFWPFDLMNIINGIKSGGRRAHLPCEVWPPWSGRRVRGDIGKWATCSMLGNGCFQEINFGVKGLKADPFVICMPTCYWDQFLFPFTVVQPCLIHCVVYILPHVSCLRLCILFKVNSYFA